MKLTNTIRDAFVRAAMNDVPSVDYDEQTRKAVLAAVLDILPTPVVALWNDAKTRPYLSTRSVCLSAGSSVMVPWPDRYESDRNIQASMKPDAREEIAKLISAMRQQEEQRKSLERKMHACAYSVTTRKALVNMLPEFEKYLPADEPAALRTLPAVANVVADFVKAGWPKGKAAA